jgi:hypothetical protein
MSLNGLEDEKIKEAYQAAVAEPGGWYANAPLNSSRCTKWLHLFLFLCASLYDS